MTDAPAIVGPWAREKLEALARYLNFYTTALKNQRWKTLYVDAYAGGGRGIVRTLAQPHPGGQLPLLEQGQADEEEAQLINGSPLVALGIDTPFDEYVFIEPDPQRRRELSSLKVGDEATRHIEIRSVTAREGLAWLVGQKSKRTHRGIVFLDPFGTDLDWETIESIASNGYLEVIINFTLHMGIQRMLPNSGVVPVEWADRLDRYFGTPEWRDEVYKTNEGDLFGNGFLAKQPDYHSRLLELYRRRLKKCFGHVSTAKLIRNTKGAPLYYLLWAGPHSLGLKGADHILRMGVAPLKERRRA